MFGPFLRLVISVLNHFLQNISALSCKWRWLRGPKIAPKKLKTCPKAVLSTKLFSCMVWGAIFFERFTISISKYWIPCYQGCIFRLTCSHRELTKDHVLRSVYVKIFRTVTRNAVNKSVWRKKDCFWLPLNKHAMNIWLSSLKIRAHLSWRTGKLSMFSMCSELTPRAHVRDNRIPQLMQPCQFHTTTYLQYTHVCHPSICIWRCHTLLQAVPE